MRRTSLLFLSMLVMLAVFLSACGPAQPQNGDPPGITIPAEYAGKTNPLIDSAEHIPKGKSAYDSTCSACHGNTGLGDGPASASLTPPPTNLVELTKTAQDDFLFWRISEGVQGTAMAGWKSIYSEEQIWQLISYIRTFDTGS